MILFLALIALLVARCMFYEKMGIPGWKSLVPVYSEYALLVQLGINPWWLLINFCLPIVQPAAGIYLSIIQNVSIARSFGKKDSYAFGLILLPIVFVPILAWSDAKYKKTKPMNDFVLGNIGR